MGINVSLIFIHTLIYMYRQWSYFWFFGYDLPKNNDINKTKKTPGKYHRINIINAKVERRRMDAGRPGKMNSGKGWFHTLKLTANAPENSPEPQKFLTTIFQGRVFVVFCFE